MGVRFAAALILVVSACGPATTSSGGGAQLRIFAAASLRDVVEVAARRFEAVHRGLEVQVSFASSTALRVQIEHGAPADVLLSADIANADALVTAGLAVGPTTVFARNSLAIVVPANDPAGIASPIDLARTGVKVIAAGDGVPITAYTRRLIDNLAAIPGYPPGYAESVAANIVSREDDVRAVLAKVELGEGDAGIVYATDAAVSTRVRTVAVPGTAVVAAEYGGVVLRGSGRPVAAAEFLDWLAGPEGQELLAGFGFEVAR